MYISDGGIEMTPNKVVMNTVIAAAISGLLICLINQGSNLKLDEGKIKDRQLLYHYNVHELCNGVLAGMVSVTASCNNIDLWAALVIGIVGSGIYMNSKMLLTRYEIDDPMQVS